MQNIIAEYINTYQETIQIALQKHDEITGMGGTIAPYGFFVVILFCVAGAISGIVLRKAWISSRRGYQKVEGLFAFIIGMIYAFLATAVPLPFPLKLNFSSPRLLGCFCCWLSRGTSGRSLLSCAPVTRLSPHPCAKSGFWYCPLPFWALVRRHPSSKQITVSAPVTAHQNISSRYWQIHNLHTISHPMLSR